MMSHAEFVVGYENGRVGCSVSVLATLRLFLAGQLHQKRVSEHLRLWSIGIAVLVAASVIGLFTLPVLWALSGTVAILAVYTVALFDSVGGLVLSTALANQEFYEFATAKRLLWIYSDDEDNAPKLRKSATARRTPRS
jgi:hypothetical protein